MKKQMKKQMLSLVVSAAMTASMMPKPAFAADNTTFPDMPNDWSTQALQNAINNGLLNGIDGKIAAGENLTRAQMAAIVTRAFGTNGKADISSFGDVNTGDWFYDAMASSVLMGAIQGDGVNLNPNTDITRQEAFTVLARLFTLSGGDQSVLNSYTDGDQVADWAKDSMASMVAAGYVKGFDNKLNPQDSITRAEFAQVMDNLVKTYFADSQLNVNANGNAVLNKAGTLEGATISGDLIIGDGAAEGDVVLKDVTVSGRLLVRGGGTSTVTLEGNTTVSSIVVNKPTGAVRVENTTDKAVNVNAVSNNVVLTGEYDQVNANASQGTITLNDADVATMNVAGTSAKVVVENGSTVTTISVTGADATVKAEEGAKIEKITTSAANTSVSGKGSVANFEAAQGSSGADITTDGTKVVNNGTGDVTTGNDKVIGSGSTGTSESDNTDTNPGGGGSGGGGGSVVESSDVVVAPMVDQAADNGIASENLCSSYSVSGTVNGDVHTIKITAKDVMLHTNQQQRDGHWVGFGIPAAEGNVYYAGFGSVPADLGSPVASIANRTYEVNGKTYNTVYFSGDTEDEYKNGAYVVVKNGDKTTTYNITFDVSFFKADVSVLTSIPEVILDAYDENIRHKTAEGLGLTASTNGTTVTLSGETTAEKLDATDEATDNGYITYGFNVGTALIKTLSGDITPDGKALLDFSDGGTVEGAESMTNAALLNVQIWDNANSSFIKKTVSMELKDAAGRVQDTVELTFDATGCKIEGQHSVTFKDAADGNTIQSISVENDGTVTLPSNPSKEGFKFLGWYSDEDTEFTAETHVTADMTVYAKWVATSGGKLPTKADWKFISSYTLNKDYELTEAYEVPADKTLVIKDGVTLNVKAAITGEGTIKGSVENALPTPNTDNWESGYANADDGSAVSYPATFATMKFEEGGSYGEMGASTTYVYFNEDSSWVAVQEKNLTNRAAIGSGQGGSGVGDFNYEDAYKAAGIKLGEDGKTYTVYKQTLEGLYAQEKEENKLESSEGTLYHLFSPGSQTIYFGMMLDYKPVNAKAAYVYGTDGSFATKLNLEKQEVSSGIGIDLFDSKITMYFKAAAIGEDGQVSYPETTHKTARTIVWVDESGKVLEVTTSEAICVLDEGTYPAE